MTNNLDSLVICEHIDEVATGLATSFSSGLFSAVASLLQLDGGESANY